MALLYEQQGHVVTITLNRPEAMNAIDPETHQELIDAWARRPQALPAISEFRSRMPAASLPPGRERGRISSTERSAAPSCTSPSQRRRN